MIIIIVYVSSIYRYIYPYCNKIKNTYFASEKYVRFFKYPFIFLSLTSQCNIFKGHYEMFSVIILNEFVLFGLQEARLTKCSLTYYAGQQF